MVPRSRRSLLSKYTPALGDHGLLQIWDVEARLGRHEGAYLVLSLRSNRIVTSWTQPDEDGVHAWSSGDQAWEWTFGGSKVPQEAIRAEVFASPNGGDIEPGAVRRRGEMLGFFDIDLCAVNSRVEESQRLESYAFIPCGAKGLDPKKVRNWRLSVIVRWEARTGPVATAARRGKELRRLLDPLLQVKPASPVSMDLDGLSPDVAPAVRKPGRPPKQDCLRCRQLKKELTMQQWESHQLWEEQCGSCGWAATNTGDADSLLAEDLIGYYKRLHDVAQCNWSFPRSLPKSPRFSTSRRHRHRLGRSQSQGELQERADVPSGSRKAGLIALQSGIVAGTWPSGERPTSALHQETGSERGAARMPSLPPFASVKEDAEDWTSEVSRFLRQNRHVSQARTIFQRLPCSAARAVETWRGLRQ